MARFAFFSTLNYTRPRAASRGRRWRVGDHLALAALDDGADMVFPQRKRGADLALVARSVVDASRASLVAGLVVKDLLDDVRLHADVGQLGGNGPPDVVQRPSDDARALIKRLLLVIPAREAVIGAGAEQLITRRETRNRVDNVERRRH